MFEITFYQDSKGNKPVLDYINELNKGDSKNNRINIIKIYDYIDVLREAGTSAGESYMKHLDGDIWELRPIRNRIVFAAWNGKGFILLHHFIKKTKKTPLDEIRKAKRELADWKGRDRK